MSRDDEYRRQAAYAEKQSQLATNASDRESWLRIAQGYVSLLRKRRQSEDDSESQK
jgi:signal transduction histidine kinase